MSLSELKKIEIKSSIFSNHILMRLEINYKDFPDDALDKSLPANAGDMGSIPGLGRFHMLQSS